LICSAILQGLSLSRSGFWINEDNEEGFCCNLAVTDEVSNVEEGKNVCISVPNVPFSCDAQHFGICEKELQLE